MSKLTATDPDIAQAIVNETRRQAEGLELIASEVNLVRLFMLIRCVSINLKGYYIR